MSTYHPHAPARRVVPAVLLAVAAVFASVLPARAQLLDSVLPTPRLVSVLPPGGKVGSVVEATLTGVDLDEPEKLLFSHPGLKAELIPPPPPDPKAPPPPPNGPKPPVKVKITIGADVPLGMHDVRLAGKWGVSNARTFVVGDLNEVLEKEPNNDLPEAQRVEINTTVSGTFASGTDVDYYVFAGKKGQRVVLSCLASSIDSRAHPELVLWDSKNHMLTTNRNYSGYDALTDCTLPDDGDYYVRLFEFTHTANIPGGSTEYFYRLTITTAPWIDAIHPVVLEPGKATQVTIHGRNLPGGQPDPTALTDDRMPLDKVTATITAPADPAAAGRLAFSGRVGPGAAGLDGFEYRVRNDAGSSNPFLLTFARAPVVLDNENNDTMETAQELTAPCEVAGRVEKRRDRDWYVLTAKKGDTYNVEITSERLGSPALMYLVVRDEKKNVLYESPPDNTEVFSQKFFSRTEDPPLYRFTAPADGKYYLLVASHLADTLAGVRHLYKLRVAPEQPDFQVVAVGNANTRPDACNVLQGGQAAFTVFASRRDGFAGDITLTVEGLPPGVTCPPQTIGGGVKEAELVFSAAADAAAFAGEIKIKGTATIKGQAVVREARAGGVVWPSVQPNQAMPLVGRLERSIVLAVREKAPYSLAAAIDNAVLTQGDPAKPTTATITVKLTRLWPDFKTPLAVQAVIAELPGAPNQPGSQILLNNNQPVTIAPDQTEAKLPVVVNANVLPGVYSIVLRTSSPIPFNRDPKAPKQPANVVQPSLPVTVTVLPRVVATLTLANPNPTLKAGGQVEVVVKAARLYDYAGELKVSLVPPAAVKDVTAAEVVIPAGKDEVTLVLKAPPEAPPGGRNDLVVRAVGMVNGNVPTTQEVKFNLNVTK